MEVYCKICGQKTLEMLNKNSGIKYYSCRCCDFIFKDENSILPRGEELKIYNNHNNSIDDPKYVNFFKKFLNSAVFSYCSGKEGLDFGSGPSPVLAMLLKRDFGFKMDIYDLFFAPGKIYKGKKYDLITSTEVLEHLKNPLPYFKIFRNCLKPDGLLSIMTLFQPGNKSEFFEWYYIRDMSHISFYTPKTLEIIGEKFGLKVVYTDNFRYISFKLS